MSGPNQKVPPGGPGSRQTPGNRLGGPGTGSVSDEKISDTIDIPVGMAVPTPSEPSLSRRNDARLGQMFGKYRVEAVIGKGGMGLVYEGEDTVLSRRVAIKFLPESLTSSPKAVERFITEAQVAGRLNHPNIIAIYDIGQEDEHYYIVMELLNPSSASSHVKEKGPLHYAEACKIIMDCCSALHAAHQAGLVHRDIKPDNILCSPMGTTKLVDFGLVKDVHFDEGALTQTGVVAGTPLYMSPEQASDGEVDRRSDIYSLGATFYTLLTAKPPYTGDAAPQIMFKHVTAPTPDPRDISPDVPESVVAILRRAMEKSPADRYQSADEMRQALETVLATMTRKPFVFLVEHEPSLLMMKRPLRVTLPPPLNPRLSAQMPIVGQPSNRSLVPLENSNPRSSGQSSRISGNSTRVSGQNAPIGDMPSVPSGRLSQQQSSYPAFLGGIGVAAGLLALVLVLWRVFKPVEPLVNVPSQKDAGSVAALAPLPPIRVGVLNSLSGTMAISTRPIVEATLLAIDEINDQGGVLGRRIDAVRVDGRSDNATFALETERLIKQEHVTTIFGGWTPLNRRAMKPLVEKYDHLLIFPARDEGMEDSQNIIYLGSTPNQQVIPATHWALEKLGARRLFFIGLDGLWGHISHELVRDVIKGTQAKIVGKEFVLLSETDFSSIVKKIQTSKADVVLNFVQGDSNLPLFRELRAAGVTPAKVPVISFGIGENEISQLDGVDLTGDYLAWSYFESVDRPQNKQFVEAFKKKFGDHRGISDPMEAAYAGVYLWARAVKAAGSDDVRAIRKALQGQSIEGPGATLRLDPGNNHAWKMFRMGKLVGGNHIEVVYGSDKLLSPDPFPGTRTRAEWEALLQFLHSQWKGNWVNTDRPNLLKRGK
ncbi:MAG TPA: transporter substrate-binding protein [Pseudomonadota bacterium]|nr:transporter substrate-binding protein [Pseudomonadota bacterium]